MPRIIHKNSNGLDIEPNISELDPGELAINTVTGVLYHKVISGNSETLVSTSFENPLNRTQQPYFTLPWSATEGTVIDVYINNYNASAVYSVDITGGIIDTSSNPFKWTLPAVQADTEYGIRMSAIEHGKIESVKTPYKYINVLNVDGIVDEAIILDSTNITPSIFQTLSGFTVSDGKLIRDILSVGTAKTIQYNSDIGTVWKNFEILVDVRHKNLLNKTIASDPTTIYLNSDSDLTVNDIFISVSEDGVNSHQATDIIDLQSAVNITHVCSSHNYSVLLDSDGLIHQFGLVGFNIPDFPGKCVKIINVDSTESTLVGLAESGDVYVIGYVSEITNNTVTYNQFGLSVSGYIHDWTKLQISNIIDIAATQYGLFCIDTTNSLYAIGASVYGELGISDTSTFVNTGIKAKSIKTNARSSMIIDMNDVVNVCGYCANGELGINSTTQVTTFTNIGLKAKKIFMGYKNSLVIGMTDDVYITGDNTYGQIMDGTTVNRLTYYNTGFKATSVYMSEYSVIAIGIDSKVYVGIDIIDVINGTVVGTTTFTYTGKYGVDIDVSTYLIKSLYIKSDDKSLFAKGNNPFIKLGTPSTDSIINDYTELVLTSKSTKKVVGITPPLFDGPVLNTSSYKTYSNTFDTSSNHAAYIDSTGQLYVRGDSAYGKLGLGDTVPRTDWTPTNITNAVSVACTEFTTHVILDDNSVYVCGKRYYSALGFGPNGNDVWTFTDTGFKALKVVASGLYKVLYIGTDNYLYSVGTGSFGSHGLGIVELVYTITRVPTNGKVYDVAIEDNRSIILLESGEVYICGQDATYSFTSTGLYGKSISVTGNTYNVLTHDNKLMTMGTNYNGVAGVASSTSYFTEVPITGFTPDRLYGNTYLSFILSDTGDVYVAGSDRYGIAGKGISIYSYTKIFSGAIDLVRTSTKLTYGLVNSDGSLYVSGSSNYTIAASGIAISGFIKMDAGDFVKEKYAFINYLTISTRKMPYAIYKDSLSVELTLDNVVTKQTIENITATTGGLRYKYKLNSISATTADIIFSGLSENEYIRYSKLTMISEIV